MQHDVLCYGEGDRCECVLVANVNDVSPISFNVVIEEYLNTTLVNSNSLACTSPLPYLQH
jgi:hypothetical protein